MIKSKVFAVMALAAILAMAIPAAAVDLQPGLDIKGQWTRNRDLGRFAKLKIISLTGTKVKLAYATNRFSYEGISENSFGVLEADITEQIPGTKEVKFVGKRDLADFVFTFISGVTSVTGTWTNTLNQTWRIEMK